MFVSKWRPEEKQQTPRQSVCFKGRVIPGEGDCRMLSDFFCSRNVICKLRKQVATRNYPPILENLLDVIRHFHHLQKKANNDRTVL